MYAMITFICDINEYVSNIENNEKYKVIIKCFEKFS